MPEPLRAANGTRTSPGHRGPKDCEPVERSTAVHTYTMGMFALVLAAAAMGACGGAAPPPPSERYLNALFHQIQVHEARQEDAEAQARREPTCTGRCPSVERLGFHAERICALATRARERDAQDRCKLARRRACSGLAQSRRAGCTCPGDTSQP